MSVQYSCFNCGVDLDEDHKVRYVGDAAMPICQLCFDSTMTIITPECIYCGNRTHVTVANDGYAIWRKGALIQNAFPEMKMETREMLISGTHPECWDELFEDSEDN